MQNPEYRKTDGFTRGFIREPQEHMYDMSYFNGKRRNYGVQFPADGSYLDPEADRNRKKFTGLLTWMQRYLPSESKILDVGCGPGHLTYWSEKLQFPYDILGLDRSLEVLTSEFNRNKNRIVVEKINILTFHDTSFNGIIFSDVLEHVYPAESLEAVKEARRVLVDGGYVFINIPNRATWSNKAKDDVGHVWLPTPEEVKRMLDLAGFDPETVTIFTKRFPLLSPYLDPKGRDLRMPWFGRSIYAIARKGSN